MVLDIIAFYEHIFIELFFDGGAGNCKIALILDFKEVFAFPSIVCLKHSTRVRKKI